MTTEIGTDALAHLPGEPGGDAYDCHHHVAVRLSFVVEYGCYGGKLDLADEACRSAIAELVSDRIRAADGVEIYDLSRLEVMDTCREGTDPVTDPSELVSYGPDAIAWTERD